MPVSGTLLLYASAHFHPLLILNFWKISAFLLHGDFTTILDFEWVPPLDRAEPELTGGPTGIRRR
jgi:hypothetical protein